MRADFYYPSKGAGEIHACRWMPEREPIGVFQIVHGIAEHIERYDAFADYLNSLGYLVVAEDHMGHGGSVAADGIRGYFHGGWFRAVADTYTLLQNTKAEYPSLPYVLFGHSMGSFMVRTILSKYPDSGIAAAIICGTGWQSQGLLPIASKICDVVCKKIGEENPSELLDKIVFGSYNKRVEHPRTAFDWLTRDSKIVDAYIASPLCGFTASSGLLRDLLKGISYIQDRDSLEKMSKTLPVLFVAGGDDPVGDYGKGVLRTVEEFRKAGMQDLTSKIYPLCRHEILNEINRDEVYRDISNWLSKKINI